MDIGSDWEGWDFPRPSSPPSAGGMESQTLWSLWRTNFLDSFPPPSVILPADCWLVWCYHLTCQGKASPVQAWGNYVGSIDLTNGWKWNHAWLSCAKFEGSFNNGVFDIMLADLKDSKETLQNSIDSLFPIDTHGTMHAIFTEQLSISHKKAVLVVAVSLTSIQDNEVLRFDKWTKSLFQDVKMVRHLLAYTRSCAAMIWGSLHTAD